ncbi:hypothetical protein EC915_10921 [Pseudomonas sp. LP_7_YM]|nr:hypothetical protein EC915_10921 [Pseudomonas sp. LP_7_YM]
MQAALFCASHGLPSYAPHTHIYGAHRMAEIVWLESDVAELGAV